MTTELLLRYLHFISVFTIVGTVVSEHLLLKKEMSRGELSRLSRVDAVYGLAALTLVTVGLTLWLGGYGKPTEFYSKNGVFHAKLTLFILVGLLSIYPTVFFIRSRKGDSAEVVKVPAIIFWLLRVELLLLSVIPLLAVLMARGIGYFGE